MIYHCTRCQKELSKIPGRFWLETWPLNENGEPALARETTITIPRPQDRRFICFACLTLEEMRMIVANA